MTGACVKYVCSNLPETMDRLNISGCQKHNMMDKSNKSVKVI